MFDITKDIHSVTTFRRNPGQFSEKDQTAGRADCERQSGSGRQDAESYQRLLDIAVRADVHEAIRQGLEDVAHGRTRPAHEVFNEIRRRHGIPR
jgi:hypothetical protein